jgi:DNA mismatch endonuclease, patch repair protein
MPSRPGITAIMRGNKKRETRPEIAVRSALHHAGLRFRKDYPIRPDNGRPIRVDIAFPRRRVAVFIDGCFWHRCPEHGNEPRVNTTYWGPKLTRNVTRDHEVDERLRQAGWAIVRIWEHEPPTAAVNRVRSALQEWPSTTREAHPSISVERVAQLAHQAPPRRRDGSVPPQHPNRRRRTPPGAATRAPPASSGTWTADETANEPDLDVDEEAF